MNTTITEVAVSTIADAKQRLTITGLWPLLGLEGEPKKICRSPFRADRNPSFGVFVDTDGDERFKDFATGETGDVLDFLAKARGQSVREALPEFLALAKGTSVTAPKARPADTTATRAEPNERRVRIHPANLNIGTAAEFQALSGLRGISVEGLHLASDQGVLRFGRHRFEPCWLLTDDTYRLAQWRRLDGHQFEGGQKSVNEKGSDSTWPLNVHSLRARSKAALLEGGPDLLAAFGYAYAEEKERSVAIVGMMGASCSIAEDALPLFAGKEIKLFPHADAAGMRAARCWWEQLESVGAVLSWFQFAGLIQENGEPVKDFNDLCAISPDDFESNRKLWEVLP